MSYFRSLHYALKVNPIMGVWVTLSKIVDDDPWDFLQKVVRESIIVSENRQNTRLIQEAVKGGESSDG